MVSFCDVISRSILVSNLISPKIDLLVNMRKVKMIISKKFHNMLVMHPKNNFLSPYLTSMYYKMLANKPMYFMSTTRNVDENGEIDK